MRFRASDRVGPRLLSLEIDYFGTSEQFSGRKKKRKIFISKILLVRLTGRML